MLKLVKRSKTDWDLNEIYIIRFKEETKLVDEVMNAVQTSNITEDIKVNKCRALVITQLLRVNKIKNKKKEEPFWKRKTNAF